MKRDVSVGLGVGALAAVLLAVGTAGSAFAAESPAQRGHELVLKNCGVCHAVGVKDKSPNPAAPAFRELHTRYPIDDLAEALAEGILTGHPQMPEFSFPPDDVKAIIEYLKSIQTKQGA
ncbi:cytochrome c [Phenylobacterium sp.]|uniref:c-type cytochrome n=1 Tax=Phenylobacterium sp. TaxID=1871053 RepID=UPI0035B1443D